MELPHSFQLIKSSSLKTHNKHTNAWTPNLVGMRRVYINVTGGEKSNLNLNSNPVPLAYHASALTTELLRPAIFTNSHTPGDIYKEIQMKIYDWTRYQTQAPASLVGMSTTEVSRSVSMVDPARSTIPKCTKSIQIYHSCNYSSP